MVHVLKQYRQAYDNALAARKMDPEAVIPLPDFNAETLHVLGRYAKGIEPRNTK